MELNMVVYLQDDDCYNECGKNESEDILKAFVV